MRRGRVCRNGYRRHIRSHSNHNQRHRNHAQKNISQRIFFHNYLHRNHKSDRILIPNYGRKSARKASASENNSHTPNNRNLAVDRTLMFSKPMFADGRSCPHCNTESLHRSHRRGIKDRFFNLLALRPVRCTCCCQRFYAPRAAHGPHIRPIAGPTRLN